MLTPNRIFGRLATMATAMALHGVAAAQIFVDDDAPPGGDGTSWQTAFNDLQVALDAWSGSETIELRIAEGIYIPPMPSQPSVVNGFGTAGPLLESGITLEVAIIRGGFAGLSRPDNPDAHDPSTFVTHLQGDRLGDDAATGNHDDNAEHVLSFIPYRTTLLYVDGLTISNGRARGNAWPGSLGAAIFARNTHRLSLRDSIITDNESAFAGAIYAPEAEEVFIIGCTLTDNRADVGAVFAADHQPRVVFAQSIIERNTASTDGGVAYMISFTGFGGSISFWNCLLAGNTAGRSGGAVFATHSDCNVLASTIVGNAAERGGFAFLEHQSTARVLGSVFSGNAASISGDSMSIGGYGQKELELEYSVLDGGLATLQLDPGVGVTTTQVFDADPLFRDRLGADGLPGTGDEDYRLRGASLAVDLTPYDFKDQYDIDRSGTTWERWPFDLAGGTRYSGPQMDAGAYEYDCPVDISGSTDPNNPAYGRPDGLIDGADFFTFLDRFAARDPRADLTSSADPSHPGYGMRDGAFTAADFFYFLDRFVEGCE